MTDYGAIGQEPAKQPAENFSYYTDSPVPEDPRGFIGGDWDEIGLLQLQFLQSHGLMPNHVVLDMGCGCLRGGVHLIPYLDAGNYYGIDINENLLTHGYTVELSSDMQGKLPRDNLHACPDFNAGFWGPQHFDYAISISLWTHLPLSEIRKSLTGMAAAMRPGGIYFSSIFPCYGKDCDQEIDEGYFHSFPDRDPYHVDATHLAAIANELGIQFEYIGNFSHPRNQMMTKFTF